MLKDKLLRQIKPRPNIGAIQVQVSTTMSHYMVYVNMGLMSMMFWHTTAGPLLEPYYPNASYLMFIIFMLFLLLIIMLADYKFVYPSRQAFVNQQAFKHGNPTVAKIMTILENQAEIFANQKKIMKKLGIEND